MVDKSPIGYIPGKTYFLEKKTRKNPKYSHIGPTIKTGYHVDNIRILSDKHIADRKGEMFKRIKCSTVANLMRREKHRENIYNLIKNSYSTSTINQSAERETHTRGTVNRSEYSGYSRKSKDSGLTYATSQLSLNENTEYIIVDFRDKEEYDLFHIHEALHFPGPAIARDKFPPEVYSRKNKFNCLIIVYHADEKHGIPYAAGLFDKGFENVFLISGGIEAFMEEASDLIRGRKLPPIIKKDTKSSILYKRSNHSEYPTEGGVYIPSTHITEEFSDHNNSFIAPSKVKTVPPKRAQSIGRVYMSRAKIF